LTGGDIMEQQVTPPIETTIVETEKFTGIAKVGDEVYIYIRLADMYDKTAIAMRNSDDEVVGYLNREVAKGILPYINRGLKFQCVVTGGLDGEGDVPIEMHPRLVERMNQMKQEAHPITSVSGVGPVSGEALKSVGINTDADLIQRVESVGAEKVLEDIKQSDQGVRLSLNRIKDAYENAKAEYIPTQEEVGKSAK